MEAVEILFLIPDSLPFEERQMRLGQWTATRHMIRLFGADPRTLICYSIGIIRTSSSQTVLLKSDAIVR
jgi:hypothetical protein